MLSRLGESFGSGAPTRLSGRFVARSLAALRCCEPTNRWSWGSSADQAGPSKRRSEGSREPFCIALLAEGCDVATLIVCEGDEEAPLGGLGATIAARTLADCAGGWTAEIGRFPERGTVEGWLLLARDRIRSVAAERGADPSDFATTAIVLSSDGAKTDVCHVGRGAVLARDASAEEWLVVSRPTSDTPASSGAFLGAGGPSAMRWQRHDALVDALVVVTKDLEPSAMDPRSEASRASFLEPIIAPGFAKPSFGYSGFLSSALTSHLARETVNDRRIAGGSILLARRERPSSGVRSRWMAKVASRRPSAAHDFVARRVSSSLSRVDAGDEPSVTAALK